MNVNYPSGGIASLLSSPRSERGLWSYPHGSRGSPRVAEPLLWRLVVACLSIPKRDYTKHPSSRSCSRRCSVSACHLFPIVGPLAAAGLVGAGETIRTGDLGKGLMAGLGAYGGAGLAGSLMGAGATPLAGMEAAALENPAVAGFNTPI